MYWSWRVHWLQCSGGKREMRDGGEVKERNESEIENQETAASPIWI